MIVTTLVLASLGTEPMLLYGLDPIPRTVHLVHADDDGVHVVDGETTSVLDGSHPVLMVRPVQAPLDHPQQGMLILRDGQRFPGALTVRPDGVAVWAHPWLGHMRIDLELVSAIGLTADPPESAHEDVVLLGNGDRLDGFIAEVGQSVVLETSEGELVDIPRGRVSAMRFAQSPIGPCLGCAVFRDGSHVRLSHLHIAADEHAGTATHALQVGDQAGHPAGSMPTMDDIVALPVSGVIQPLSTTPLTPRPHEGVIGAVPPEPLRTDAVLGLSGLRFIGPGQWRLPVPDSAMRLLCTAHAPPRLASRGSRDLIIRVDGQELHRLTFSEDALGGTIDIPLTDAQVLEIEMTGQPVGAVIDLHHPVLVLNPGHPD